MMREQTLIGIEQSTEETASPARGTLGTVRINQVSTLANVAVLQEGIKSCLYTFPTVHTSCDASTVII